MDEGCLVTKVDPQAAVNAANTESSCHGNRLAPGLMAPVLQFPREIQTTIEDLPFDEEKPLSKLLRNRHFTVCVSEVNKCIATVVAGQVNTDVTAAIITLVGSVNAAAQHPSSDSVIAIHVSADVPENHIEDQEDGKDEQSYQNSLGHRRNEGLHVTQQEPQPEERS
ncbi:hypothetical protein KIL84_018420 [Mauremys mutica]|uniref:Uncharacterized protein n=1 Tax=Mauremys mutica TaxID=74926 RepID=A0A9D4B9E1_9SAUR|nr:hypothetical protein KIL84_018420 [Mauremys mutica]